MLPTLRAAVCRAAAGASVTPAAKMRLARCLSAAAPGGFGPANAGGSRSRVLRRASPTPAGGRSSHAPRWLCGCGVLLAALDDDADGPSGAASVQALLAENQGQNQDHVAAAAEADFVDASGVVAATVGATVGAAVAAVVAGRNLGQGNGGKGGGKGGGDAEGHPNCTSHWCVATI